MDGDLTGRAVARIGGDQEMGAGNEFGQRLGRARFEMERGGRPSGSGGEIGGEAEFFSTGGKFGIKQTGGAIRRREDAEGFQCGAFGRDCEISFAMIVDALKPFSERGVEPGQPLGRVVARGGVERKMRCGTELAAGSDRARIDAMTGARIDFDASDGLRFLKPLWRGARLRGKHRAVEDGACTSDSGKSLERGLIEVTRPDADGELAGETEAPVVVKVGRRAGLHRAMEGKFEWSASAE